MIYLRAEGYPAAFHALVPVTLQNFSAEASPLFSVVKRYFVLKFSTFRVIPSIPFLYPRFKTTSLDVLKSHTNIKTLYVK